jgi:ADP-ribose pyrophosphatase
MSEMPWRPNLHKHDAETKEVNLVYDGEFKVNKIHLRHKNFDGQWTPWIWREQIRRRNAAAVLLWDPKEDKVVMIEQFRVGLIKENVQSPWLLEIVAGLIDEGESPEQTAKREAVEEAGCSIQKLIKIGEFFNSPGGFAENTYVYLGLIDATGAGGVYGIAEEHENIQVHVLPFDEVLHAFENQQWTSSASTIIALLWLSNNKERFQYV